MASTALVSGELYTFGILAVHVLPTPDALSLSANFGTAGLSSSGLELSVACLSCPW